MITMKCQSPYGPGDTLVVDETGDEHKPELTFVSTCVGETYEIVIDVEQATKLGAALTAWAKRNGNKANDPKKYVGSL